MVLHRNHQILRFGSHGIFLYQTNRSSFGGDMQPVRELLVIIKQRNRAMVKGQLLLRSIFWHVTCRFRNGNGLREDSLVASL